MAFPHLGICSVVVVRQNLTTRPSYFSNVSLHKRCPTLLSFCSLYLPSALASQPMVSTASRADALATKLRACPERLRCISGRRLRTEPCPILRGTRCENLEIAGILVLIRFFHDRSKWRWHQLLPVWRAAYAVGIAGRRDQNAGAATHCCTEFR
jgi:hypothetical protein